MTRARRWAPRANTAVRPLPSTTAPGTRASWQRPGSLDPDTWPSPGAALGRRTVGEFPGSVIGELAVAREWLARWEAEPPQSRNRAYEAMRDYLDVLEQAVAAVGEFAWWNHFNNY